MGAGWLPRFPVGAGGAGAGFEGKVGKGWVKKYLPVTKLELAMCRQNSPSFDKLCRELTTRLTTAG